MSPSTARCVLQAMRNHRQPARTIGARAHDAVLHVRNSDKKKAVGKDGLEMEFTDERTSNNTLPAAKNHPPSL